MSDRYERIQLSEQDTLLVLNLLENPPPPNARLIAALASAASRSPLQHATVTNDRTSHPAR